MKRKKQTVSEWAAHLPEWEAACEKTSQAAHARDVAIRELQKAIEVRNELYDKLFSVYDEDELRELEHEVDVHAEKLVECSANLKRARQNEGRITMKYGYWR